MDAATLKASCARYFVKKRYCANFEVGLNRRGRLRADVVCLAMTGHLVIVETKSGPADFLKDEKWPYYLDYCHQFYFAMDAKTYDKIGHLILDRRVGVMIPSPNPRRDGTYPMRCVKPARKLELPEEVATTLFIRMAFRAADCNRYKRQG